MGDAHSPQEIKVFTGWLVHYLPKLTAHLVCLSTSIDHMGDHMGEWVGGPGSCARDCSSSWHSIFQRVTKCPGDLEAEQGTVIPGGKCEQKPMDPHCLGLVPMEEAAEFPTPQVEKNDPGGRKKCWVWRNGLNGSEKAINAFILWPLSKELRNPGQLTPRSMWLAAWATAHLVAKVISRGISVSVRAKSLKPQVCV